MDENTNLLGPLEPLLAWPGVTDILVNGDGTVWVDCASGLVRVPIHFDGEAQIRELATMLVAAGGRHVDFATPLVDVRLSMGLRVHVAVPPVSPLGTVISIRVASRQVPALAMFQGGGAHDHALGVVRRAVARRANILIAGATGSGKTTLLSALLAEVDSHERIIVVEDVREIVASHPHLISLEARQANTDGRGAIGLSALVRACLRMRPDRIVVGECRGAEIRDLLSALNTGHSGGMATIHANDLASVPARIATVAEQAHLRGTDLAMQVDAAFDLVVFVERRGSARRIGEIGVVRCDGGQIVVEPLALSPPDPANSTSSSELTSNVRSGVESTGLSSAGLHVA